MKKVTTIGAYGMNTVGNPVAIDADEIKQTSLMVAVPVSQESIILNAEFQQMIAEYEELYKATIEVIPVEGWQ